MSEKVLGFKEKDAVFCTIGDEALYFEHYKIAPQKLVPVVSLEWLEKEFAKHDGIIVNTFKKEILKKAKIQAGDEK